MRLKKLLLAILLTCITICAASTMAACNKSPTANQTYKDVSQVIIYSNDGTEINNISILNSTIDTLTVKVTTNGSIEIYYTQRYEREESGKVISYYYDIQLIYYNVTCEIMTSQGPNFEN